MIDYNKPKFDVCMNCKYWDYVMTDGVESDEAHIAFQNADCHRYPVNVPLVEEITDDGRVIPSMILLDSPLMGHPQTFGCDWCGEFEPDNNPMFPDGIYMP